ncbi:PRELI domain-containing protein 1, mitochondrial-like isoform X3 [Scyliorhinus canicula]|uniref:PRELI domain-containing protein 1, mitochondrial-like isoform X3 n=1 Tax=Scyliorhinus canicula TaxID=7830 RepID=UPI0018F45203|nr:PRELI domain-containing protein 1, mitochondrial-like isoform X3 [Scyliorhinus canicula]
MVKHFFDLSTLKSTWDQVASAFWQRYPNPFSKHVLTEDVIYREVTSDNKLVSRRLFTKTNRLPRWGGMVFPANLAQSVFVIEDSVVDLQNQTFTTLTWNVNHTRLMQVEEKCTYRPNPENPMWTQVQREAWVTSNVFGFSRAIQEFGLARFRRNQLKATEGFEYILSHLQGELPPKTLKETAKEATEKAKETALAATEKAKDLASKAAPQKAKQFV